MGTWLEDDDETVFSALNHLVLRTEIPAQNRLAKDIHFTRIKLGYPWSILEHDPNRNTFRATLPAGTKALSIQAVPNQAWDLVNKATETVLSDFPLPDPSPLNDSEQAHATAELAKRILTEDAGENGTNDIATFTNALDRSLACATSYIELWTDPVGGGYVPLQILAHPEAADPADPLTGPDGFPTTDPVLRYVTAPEGGQFTEEPAQAAPQWQAKVRATVWGREHWRLFPESATVSTAEKAIGLLYCTIGEARRRWPTVRDMDADELQTLLGWTPVRYLVLLPPFQRARWQTSSGSDKERGGSSDERIIFYYRLLQKATPDHPKGAEVIVSGAHGGMVLHKTLLAAHVSVPRDDGQKATQEVRCMDLPLVQVTPRADPDERDPEGRAYMELFCGATEANATLLMGFTEALNQWLHPDSYAPSTSPVEGFQRDESRLTGDVIPILRPEDKPVFGNQPPIPTNFFEAYQVVDQSIRSIASLNKPVTGQDTSQEISGKARQIAVSQGMVGLSRMQHPVNAAYERFQLGKLQLMMRDYSTPQLVRYVGEDGAWREQEWRGTDFALIGTVGIQAGTGTMLPPDQKVQFLANLAAEGFIPREEAADAARPTFAQRLGLADNPHEQYAERCITTWLQGPPGGPQGKWIQAWQTYLQQKQAYEAQQQQIQAQQAAQQQQAMIPPAPPAPPNPAEEHGRAMEMESHKHGLAMDAARQQHGMKLELDQTAHDRKMAMESDAQQAKQASELQHMTTLHEQSEAGKQTDLEALKQALLAARPEPPIVNVAAPIVNVPAPIVNIPAPVVHVEAAKAPVVNVAAPESPMVHVEAARAPIVNVTERNKGKRTMKGSLGGKPFEVEVSDSDTE